MAAEEPNNKFCAGCLRGNEEEIAHLWCNDCSEPICQSCGKVHRRFAIPHDVINIKDVTNISKNVPKNCILHPEQKLILFCGEHDKIICRLCLSQNHKECKNITEIEKAAIGIKDMACIGKLKEKMEALKQTVDSTRKENETRLVNVNDEKQKADGHLQRIRECVNGNLTNIEKGLFSNYDKIINRIADDNKYLDNIGKTTQNHLDEINDVIQNSSECNLFYIIKYLNETHIENEAKTKQIQERDFVRLDNLPDGLVDTLGDLLGALPDEKSPRSLSEFQESQVQAAKIMYPLVIESKKDRIFVACYLTDKNGLIVISKPVSFCNSSSLLIYDEQLNCREIPLSFCALNLCVYNTCNVLVTKQDANLIVVVNISSLKEGRHFSVHCNEQGHGYLKYCTVIEYCKLYSKIWTLVRFGKSRFEDNNSQSEICSVDFNGNVLEIIPLPNDVCDICFDGFSFYMSHYGRNSITSPNSSFNYSSIDLRDSCLVAISEFKFLFWGQAAKSCFCLNQNPMQYIFLKSEIMVNTIELYY